MSSEPPDLKVVQLREDRPLVSDIPCMLRRLADRIESGEQPADCVIVLVNGARYQPNVFCFGDALDTRSIIGMLDLAMAQRRQSLFDDDERDNPE